MNRIFLGLTIRGSCEAAWKLSRVGPRGRQAHPNAKLIEFPDLGHAPQIKAPDQVHEALLRGLGAL
jgi:pimeloyl-ACP methyl ester carboxylesterase